jgi:hypothetical protein
MPAMPESPGRKLILFQESDPFKHWWSLGEMRVCTRCEHLFTGNDIKLVERTDEQIDFHCPTRECPGTWEDWEYPELHL